MIKNESLRTKKRVKPTPLTVFLNILLIIYCLGLFIPILWSIIVSFMKYTDYLYTWTGARDAELAKLIFKPTIENFTKAWNTLPIKRNNSTFSVLDVFMNSIFYSTGCALSITVCSTIVGYATARFKFRFSNIVYGFVMVAITLPIVGSTAGELSVLDALGIRGTMGSMYLLRFNFLTIYYMILFAEFESIPMDYTEAAKIDGANNLTIMLKVILPQALPLLVTVFILTFVGYWNDIEVPILYLPDVPTASYRLYDYVASTQSGAGTAQTPVQLAATLIMCLPIIVVFSALNKKMRISVDMGGIKG